MFLKPFCNNPREFFALIKFCADPHEQPCLSLRLSKLAVSLKMYMCLCLVDVSHVGQLKYSFIVHQISNYYFSLPNIIELTQAIPGL